MLPKLNSTIAEIAKTVLIEKSFEEDGQLDDEICIEEIRASSKVIVTDVNDHH